MHLSLVFSHTYMFLQILNELQRVFRGERWNSRGREELKKLPAFKPWRIKFFIPGIGQVCNSPVCCIPEKGGVDGWSYLPALVL